MELTTKTAKRFKEFKSILPQDRTDREFGEIGLIINFKNELKGKIDVVTTRDGTFKIKCECNFCAWTRNLIQEIESVEKQ